MSKSVSSVRDVLNALPAVQRAVRAEIQARTEAGEQIGTIGAAEMRERSAQALRRAHEKRTRKKSAA